MAEHAVIAEGDSGNDKIGKRSPSRKSGGLMGYFTSLGSGKKWVSLDSFGYNWGFQLETLPKWR